ncbi:hypothetical protein CONCODRAFT_13628 [Conidiobolus coronatus NRRL 28638]|uniref:Uncharacterized protein n=1 Tax=Conidiobolus coronatus (strain ATCC 28846 / CBS 209.66 / NRRL 28638) TaxID=796925 RepID=A0A137NQG9_CONC2|nr:hypothetical protein CONCODRAFT_13628 [Conidiobolus coronatus NRRL 28638]|eukprot:KXN64962.1 hypothetical protein CONCODRAFT_13628 [Conidiobolus coronatus NRRL 28638]
MEYGHFEHICSRTTFTVCNLFPPVTYPQCTVKHIGFIPNLGNTLAICLVITCVVLIILNIRIKKAAVGKREMMILYTFYLVSLFLEILSNGQIFDHSSSMLYGFSGFHLAWEWCLEWIILLNSLIGYQLISDGSNTSIIGIVASSVVILIPTTYFNISTAVTFSKLSQKPNELVNFNLYGLFWIWPGLFLSLSFVALFCLVMSSLSVRRPLVYLVISGLCVTIGFVIRLYANLSICQFTQRIFDGQILQTLLNGLAAYLFFKFWTNITEDDWDDLHLTA